MRNPLNDVPQQKSSGSPLLHITICKIPDASATGCPTESEYQLSAQYGITHGKKISVVYQMAWICYMAEERP